MPTKRHRRVASVKNELVGKSREAAVAAVQIFNSPAIRFKSETFTVLMHIAWTYLLHAYYRGQGIEYRYYDQKPIRRRFHRTRHGAFKYWELARCLDNDASPVDRDTANNLRFLIGLRNEIEHQMTTRIDDYLSARFQAACLNYNHYLKALFGDRHGIDHDLSISLQFSSLSEEQVDLLQDADMLPPHIQHFIEGFDGDLSETEYNSPQFAYRVLFIPKTANREGQADRVIQFIKADSELAAKVNAAYALIKETEREKRLPGSIVAMMHDEGFPRFQIHHHTQLWKEMDAKNPGQGYGTQVEQSWYWYDRWVAVVRDHCRTHRDRYE